MQASRRCIKLPSVSTKFRHSHKSENVFGFLLFLFKGLQNNINPSFLFWRSQQHSLSLLLPSAAIKRCRVSECDQLLCKGLGKNSEFTYLPAEPPAGTLQPPGTAELRRELVLAVKVTWAERLSEPLLFGSGTLETSRLQKRLSTQRTRLKGVVWLCKEDQEVKALKLLLSTRLPRYCPWRH